MTQSTGKSVGWTGARMLGGEPVVVEQLLGPGGGSLASCPSRRSGRPRWGTERELLVPLIQFRLPKPLQRVNASG